MSDKHRSGQALTDVLQYINVADALAVPVNQKEEVKDVISKLDMARTVVTQSLQKGEVSTTDATQLFENLNRAQLTAETIRLNEEQHVDLSNFITHVRSFAIDHPMIKSMVGPYPPNPVERKFETQHESTAQRENSMTGKWPPDK